ncbi:MAG: hypothetical protein Q9224_003909 [Gallowayella concinna]
MSSRSSDKKRRVSRPNSPTPKRLQYSAVDVPGLPQPSSSAAEAMVPDQPPTSTDTNHIGNGTDPLPRPEPPFPLSEAISAADDGGMLTANMQRKKKAAFRKAVREGKKKEHRLSVGYDPSPALSNEADWHADEVGATGASSSSRQQRQQAPREMSRRLPKVDQFDKCLIAAPQNELEREAEQERNRKFKLGRPSPFGMNDPSPERPLGGSSREMDVAGVIEDSFTSFRQPADVSSPSEVSSASWTISLRRFSSSRPQAMSPSNLGSPVGSPEYLPGFEALSTSKAPFSYKTNTSGYTKAQSVGRPRRSFSDEACPTSRKRVSSALNVPESIQPVHPTSASSGDESLSSEQSYTQAKRSLTSMWVSSQSASSFSTDAAVECTSERKRGLCEAQNTDISSWSDGVAGDEKKQVQDRRQSTDDESSEPAGIDLSMEVALDVTAVYDGSHVSNYRSGPSRSGGKRNRSHTDRVSRRPLRRVPGRAQPSSEVPPESSSPELSLQIELCDSTKRVASDDP